MTSYYTCIVIGKERVFDFVGGISKRRGFLGACRKHYLCSTSVRRKYCLYYNNYIRKQLFYSSFESPTPSHRDILDATSHLKATVQKSLKSGINCNNKMEVEFRTDVFKFLFKDKGSKPPRGRGLFYFLEDFDSTYFSDDWYIVYDKLGDGCKVDFPVRLESKVKWSSAVHTSNGSVKRRIFTEIISVTLVKIRC